MKRASALGIFVCLVGIAALALVLSSLEDFALFESKWGGHFSLNNGIQLEPSNSDELPVIAPAPVVLPKCYFRNDLNSSFPLHNEALELFTNLSTRYKLTSNYECGCLRLDESAPSSVSYSYSNNNNNNSSSLQGCRGPSRHAQCKRKQWSWLFLVGDSQSRQFYEYIALATRNQRRSEIFYGQDRIEGSTPRSRDLVLHELKLVVSYRVFLHLTSIGLAHVLKIPTDVLDYNFSVIPCEQTRKCYFEAMPAMDWPNFHNLGKWNISLEHKASQALLEACGPDLVILGGGVWEGSMSLGTKPRYEYRKCHIPPLETVTWLWDRRLRLAFHDGCTSYGSTRFLWRNGVFNAHKNFERDVGRTPKFNAPARVVASLFNVTYIDYMQMHFDMGQLCRDLDRHPHVVVVLRSLYQTLEDFRGQINSSSAESESRGLFLLAQFVVKEYSLQVESLRASLAAQKAFANGTCIRANANQGFCNVTMVQPIPPYLNSYFFPHWALAKVWEIPRELKKL